MEGERFSYGLMAETGREERGGILKGVMVLQSSAKKAKKPQVHKQET
jgi:hypothetical protein